MWEWSERRVKSLSVAQVGWFEKGVYHVTNIKITSRETVCFYWTGSICDFSLFIPLCKVCRFFRKQDSGTLARVWRKTMRWGQNTKTRSFKAWNVDSASVDAEQARERALDITSSKKPEIFLRGIVIRIMEKVSLSPGHSPQVRASYRYWTRDWILYLRQWDGRIS